jgi:hypothetical protein
MRHGYLVSLPSLVENFVEAKTFANGQTPVVLSPQPEQSQRRSLPIFD